MSSSMDHGMHMTGMSETATATMNHATMSMEMPASTSAAMAMDHGMGNGCKISVRRLLTPSNKATC